MSQILIVDAGATKTAFAIVENGVVLFDHVGGGINPNYTPDEEISRIIEDFVRQSGPNRQVQEVRYYGAGCASLENAGRVGCHLQEFFLDARIHVYSDLMAVCHALSLGHRSIVGILGTGAATCLFDGAVMENRAPSLGYMLGDEGSGTNLGKRLLIAYLRGELPADLSATLQREQHLSFSDAIKRVYREPEPNRFMASLAPFVQQHLDNPFIRQLALSAFRDFFSIQKSHYAEEVNVEWNLSGSVAFHFQEVVREAAALEKCRVDSIIQAPMPLLVQQ